MSLLLVLIIAISLSMDAFSLSLVYGTLRINKKAKYLLSGMVGIFHFFMPLLGMFIGEIILKFIKLDPDIIVAVVLCFIGIEMILSSFKEKEEIKVMKKIEFFLFAFAVSVDSFSVGITLTNINSHYVISSLIFAICSCLFTFTGLLIGNKIEKLLGKIATIFGGVVLTIIGIIFAI